MKSMKHLVLSYRSFMEVKYGDNHEAYKIGIQLQSVFGGLVMLCVFLGIGIFTNQIENLYYVFFMLHTVVIGSFVINKVSLERKIQSEHNISYDYRGELVYQTFTLLGIVSIAQLLLLLFHTSVSQYIVFIIILLLFSGVSIYVCRYIYHYVIQAEPHRVIRNGVFLYVVFLLSRFSFGVASFEISYMIMFLTGGIIYLFKYLLTLIGEQYFSYSAVLSSVAVMFLFIYVLFQQGIIDFINKVDVDDVVLVDTVFSDLTLLPITTVDDTGYVFYETDTFILKHYRHNEYINVYDKNYTFVTTITSEENHSLREVNVIDDDVFISYVKTIPFINQITNMPDEVQYIVFSRLDEDGELQEIITVDSTFSDEVHYYEDGILYFADTGRNSDSESYLYQVTQNDFEYYEISSIGPNEIIMESKQCVFYRKDNVLKNECKKYESGYIYEYGKTLSDGLVQVHLYEIEDFILDGPYETLTIDDYDQAYDLNVSNNYITLGFDINVLYYFEAPYRYSYIAYLNQDYFYVFDHDFDLLFEVTNENLSYRGIQLLNDEIILNERYVIDPESSVDEMYLELPNHLKLRSAIMLFSLIPIGNVLMIPKGWWMP